MEIIRAETRDHIFMVRELFREYQAFLKVDLCFQSFEKELAGLPGQYAPPSGALLLAMADAEAAGCVALRPLTGKVCEMKRLYVRPDFRGRKLGRRLSREIIHEALSLGYAAMRLDTMRRLGPAAGLYRSLGFEEIPSYCENPLEDAVYLELDLKGRPIIPPP